MNATERTLLPLSGIRVLDLTKLLPGPWGTMLLGDLGADVLKVERRDGGDNSRAASPRYKGKEESESIYFSTFNRNKRSIALDLKNDVDRSRFLELAREADVVVESFRPGVADRLGIGYAALQKSNPKLVYCAITGYGQDGERHHLAGHDLNITGLSGLLQSYPGEEPAMPKVLMGDYAGGITAVVAILAAIVERERHGRGSFLDVSMLDALVSWTGIQMNGAFAKAAPSHGGAVEGWGGNPRYGIYRAADGGYLTVSLLERHFWAQFCNYIGRSDLIDPNESEADRLTAHGEKGAQYREILTDIFLSRGRDEWADAMQREGIPICPVLLPEEVYQRSPDAARGWHFEMEFPRLGFPVPQMGFPFRMTLSNGQSGLAATLAPPGLGEDSGSPGWRETRE
jgi:crotonobetainyl-CoA:carnitine CoA-transferase CaiB-like acyl-CoA transferase